MLIDVTCQVFDCKSLKGYYHLVDRAADQKPPIGAATYGIIERLTVAMSHLISNPVERSGSPLVA
jgi:hypothetical protein